LVAAAQFASLKWVTEQLGARAVMAAGMDTYLRIPGRNRQDGDIVAYGSELMRGL